MTHYFVPFAPLSSLASSIKELKVFALSQTNFVMIFPPNSIFINPITLLFFPLGNVLSDL